MHQTDTAGHNNLATVAKPQLEAAGFKVDLQAMDWQTLVSRRSKKDPPSGGGWNMFCTAWVAPDIWSPINNAALDARGEKSGWFGWPEDAKLQDLRAQFMRETDTAKKKKLAEAIQTEAFQDATHAPLGEYQAPVAVRANISGLNTSGLAHIYWNVKKN